MHKKMTYKSIVVVSVVLGVFISLQMKTINTSNNGMTTSQKGEELAIKLKSLKKEEEKIKEEIDIIKKNINNYQDKDSKKNQQVIKEEIEKYQMLAGYTDVKGQGIKVKIKTTDSSLEKDLSNSIVYNYDLLLSLVNKLNAAQANAISINGQRIVSSTYMHLKEDKLYINNNPISEPIEILAIGQSDTLASALQIKYGIVWEIEKYYNAQVEIIKDDNIKISGNRTEIDLEHSTN